MPRKINIKKAKELYQSGKTLEHVGIYFGVSRKTISRRFQSTGVHIRDKSEAARAEFNHCWKGGRIVDKDGYVNLRIDGKYVLEHRLVMEQHLGRKLKKNEIVHHINSNRQDNRFCNLKLVSPETHMKEHTTSNWSRKYTKCKVCGNNTRKHAGKGLCVNCYMRERYFPKCHSSFNV